MSKKGSLTTKTVVYCALFTALSIVLARLLGIPIMADTRISLEAVPIILAGAMFGPVAGGLVGFTADFLGSLMTFGFNPILCLPPVMIGVGTGLFRMYLGKKQSVLRWLVVEIPLFAIAYVLWQSFALTHVFGGTGAFWENYVLRLGLRSIQFSITVVVDVLIVYMLIATKIFHRINIWPPRGRRTE